MKKKLVSPEKRTRLLVAIYRKLSACSNPCLFRIAKIMAFIVLHTRNQLSSQSRENVALCFPDMPQSDQKKIVAENIHHTCCNFFELPHIWYTAIDKVLAEVNEENVCEAFYQTDRAKLIVAPHQGSWELLNLWLASKGNFYALYKPTRNWHTDQYVLQMRSRNGAQMVAVDTTGLRKLLKALKQQATCMILPDQKPRANKSCVSAPFYGHAAETSLLIKNLASKSDCDVFIAAVTRNLRKADYSLTIKKLERSNIIGSDDISAAYLNQSIMDLIDSQLAQYQWTYRRFTEQVYADHS